jgi:hypothetical protein
LLLLLLVVVVYAGTMAQQIRVPAVPPAYAW